MILTKVIEFARYVHFDEHVDNELGERVMKRYDFVLRASFYKEAVTH